MRLSSWLHLANWKSGGNISLSLSRGEKVSTPGGLALFLLKTWLLLYLGKWSCCNYEEQFYSTTDLNLAQFFGFFQTVKEIQTYGTWCWTAVGWGSTSPTASCDPWTGRSGRGWTLAPSRRNPARAACTCSAIKTKNREEIRVKL